MDYYIQLPQTVWAHLHTFARLLRHNHRHSKLFSVCNWIKSILLQTHDENRTNVFSNLVLEVYLYQHFLQATCFNVRKQFIAENSCDESKHLLECGQQPHSMKSWIEKLVVLCLFLYTFLWLHSLILTLFPICAVWVGTGAVTSSGRQETELVEDLRLCPKL